MEYQYKKIKKRLEKEKKQPKVKKQFNNRQAPKGSNYGTMVASSIGNKGVGKLLNGIFVQAKLHVGKAGDPYEQEADKVAGQIVTSNAGSSDQLKISPVQNPGSSSKSKLSNKTSSQINSLTTGGRLLDTHTRAYFEPRFGVDLSNVKIHTGNKAGNAAKQINARALTFGNNIVFGKGQYNPGSPSGKKLIAHELTHVVQQTGGKTAQTKSPTYNHLSLKKSTGQAGINLSRRSQGTFNNYNFVPTNTLPGITPKAGAVQGAKTGFVSPIKSVQSKSIGHSPAVKAAPVKGKMVQAWFGSGSKEDEKKVKEQKKKKKEKEKGGGLFGWLAKGAEWLFENALKAVGIDLAALKAMLGKGAQAIGKIIADPGAFLSNLIAGVKGGIKNFINNIKSHLIKGFTSWLFGKFAAAGLNLPDKFDLKGIFSVAMQLLGVSYDSIRTRIVTGLGKKHGEKIVSACESGFDMLKNVVANGPIALWEQLKAGLSNLKSTVLNGIIGWVSGTIIKKGMAKIMLMLNPAGAIIGIIKTVWDVISFFRNNWDKIVDFASTVIDSVYDIAHGKIGGAISKIESSLAKSIPLMLGFLAKFIGLGGITKKIMDIIKKVKKPIDNALNKAAGFVTGKIKKTKIYKNIVQGLDKVDSAKKTLKDKKDKLDKTVSDKVDKIGANKDKVTPQDKKKYEGYVDAIISKMKKDTGKGLKSFQKFHGKKETLAQNLENKYKKKVKKGVKVDVQVTNLAQDAKDNDVDFSVVISPVVPKKKGKVLYTGKKDKKDEERKDTKDDKAEEKGIITKGDKAKHKQIAHKISSSLKENKPKRGEGFDKFHKRVGNKAKSLENTYQKQLKKGIKLDVSLAELEQDKKDNDVDFKIRIAPNTLEMTGNITMEELEKMILESIKKTGTSESGEKFELLFNGEDRSTTIKVDAAEMEALAYMKSNEKEFQETNSSALNKATKALVNILKEAEKGEKSETTKEKEDLKKKNDKISEEVDKLSLALIELVGGAEAAPAPSKPDYSGIGTSPKPEIASVEKLSHGNFEYGSGPKTEDCGGWKAILDYKSEGNKMEWVRMHLINDNIGGQGDVGNLIPGPATVNTTMEKFSENPIKTTLGVGADGEKKSQNPTVMWVTTYVGYYSDEIRGYNSWPNSIKVTAGFHFYNKEKKDWEKNNSAAFSKSFSIPKPRFAAKEVNFNTATRHDLLEMNFKEAECERSDFNDLFTQSIINKKSEAGPVNSPDQFYEKMEPLLRQNQLDGLDRLCDILDRLKKVGLTF